MNFGMDDSQEKPPPQKDEASFILVEDYKYDRVLETKRKLYQYNNWISIVK